MLISACSKVIQIDIYIKSLFFILFSNIVYHRRLNIAPWAIDEDLVNCSFNIWQFASANSNTFLFYCFSIISFETILYNKRITTYAESEWKINSWVKWFYVQCRIPWRRKWQSAPVFLPEKPHGQRNLVGYSSWGRRVRHDWSRMHTV